MGAGSSTQTGGYVYNAVRHHRSTTLARGRGISLNKNQTHKRKNHNKNRKSRKGRKSRKNRKTRKNRK